MVTAEAVILWTGLLVVAITAAADYTGAAVFRADMRNWFGQLSAPIRSAIFVSVGVTLWLVAFTMVSRIAAWLRYSFDPAYESQRMQRRWVQQLRIGDRLRLTDHDKDVYCTISRVDAKKGESLGPLDAGAVKGPFTVAHSRRSPGRAKPQSGDEFARAGVN